MFAIPVSINSETDLYEPFDPAGNTLSAGLRDYLESIVEDREVGQEVRLELVSTGPIDLDRFNKAYRTHIDALLRRCKAKRAKRSANALRLLGIGIAFVMAGVALAGRIGPVPAAIISTIGSFSIWEAAAIWLEDIPSLRKSERVLSVYRRAGVSIKEKEAGI